MPLIGRAGDKVRMPMYLATMAFWNVPTLLTTWPSQQIASAAVVNTSTPLALHDKGRHIVGDDGDIEAHVAADRRGQARTLKIGARLGAEEADMLPLSLHSRSIMPTMVSAKQCVITVPFSGNRSTRYLPIFATRS